MHVMVLSHVSFCVASWRQACKTLGFSFKMLLGHFQTSHEVILFWVLREPWTHTVDKFMLLINKIPPKCKAFRCLLESGRFSIFDLYKHPSFRWRKVNPYHDAATTMFFIFL
ncbi:hypothetical protein XENOCAPTIV_020800 [Xenoophorus captivus]|uniref:Secreted protein n=1 Tax=Xenoophorus captivus TaxID=1517983 RepID=A0ABV0QK50_9TELE